MQKARRLACSTASVSSPSNTSLRPRRTSRTSSAGGDYVEVARSNNSQYPFESKFRARTRNNRARMLSKNSKSTQRNSRASKSARPPIGGLQNTVVLAPFYTLKKCFQNKLVDLYFNEKVKKNNYKSKMAEKHNMQFEYDVMELKPLEGTNSKKEKKGGRGQKGVGIKGKEPNSKLNNSKGRRSLSYCQCERNNKVSDCKEPKTDSNMKSNARLHSGKSNKRNFQTLLAAKDFQPVFSITGAEERKRRKLDTTQVISSPVCTNYEVRPNPTEQNRTSYSEQRSEADLSHSNVSLSHSKADSTAWESVSDSHSVKERVFEGSLAISTTSVDSCLEQCEKDSCNFSEYNAVKGKSSRTTTRYNTRLQALKEKSGRGNRGEDFPVDIGTKESKNLITREKMTNSDEQIIDFMDREPQTQVISTETSQHSQTLPRPSKTQTRRSNRENDSNKTYYLRSQSSIRDHDAESESKENVFQRGVENDDLEGQEYTPGSSSNQRRDSERSGRLKSGNQDQSEKDVEGVGTSFKSSRENSSSKSTQAKEQTSSKTDVTRRISKVLEADDMLDSPNQTATDHNLDLNNEPTFQIHEDRRTNTTAENTPDSISGRSPEECEIQKLDLEPEESNDGGLRLFGEFWTDRVDERSDQSILEVIPGPGTMNRFQDSSNMDRQFHHQPEDKEPSFIFGPRSTSDRLGESCEFSFGLNWVLSDDENSEHADYFL